MNVATATQRPLASRRAGVALIVSALVLGLIGLLVANAYVSDQARKVAAPLRDVWVAARDIPAATLVGPADLAVARIPVPDSLKDIYLSPAAAGRAAVPVPVAQGVSAKALRKGQPLTAGDLLSPDAATSVAPLIPLVVRVAGRDEAVAGGLNLPIGKFVSAPPKFRAGDHIDVWATTPTADGAAGETQVVLGDITVIAFSGSPDAPTGIVCAVTPEQLDRYLFFVSRGAPMILTVRSAQAR